MKGNRVFIIYCDLGCQHIKLPVIGTGSYDRLHIVEIEFHSLRIEGCSIIELYIFTQMESIGESIIGICPVCSKAGLVPVSYTHLDVYKRQMTTKPDEALRGV